MTIFAAHFKQHFKSTTARMDLRGCMPLKLERQINQIVEMKTFTKPNCDLCMYEVMFNDPQKAT